MQRLLPLSAISPPMRVALVEVDYEPLPPVIDPFKALEPDSPLVRPDREQKTNHIWHWEAGDAARTDEIFQSAEVVVKQDLYIPAHSRLLN